MSTYSAIVDAWVTDLQTNVTGLDTATIPVDQTHRYSPWSFANLSAEQGERHLAIWPQLEAEGVPVGQTVGTIGGNDIGEQLFVVGVWEDAEAESSRGFDDDTANQAWLTLAEAIRARFYVAANLANGAANTTVHYAGMAFGAANGCRTLEVRFIVRVSHSWT